MVSVDYRVTYYLAQSFFREFKRLDTLQSLVVDRTNQILFIQNTQHPFRHLYEVAINNFLT